MCDFVVVLCGPLQGWRRVGLAGAFELFRSNINPSMYFAVIFEAWQRDNNDW